MGDSSEYGSVDEKPTHQVQLDGFTMSAYEITNQQYCDFLNSLAPSEVKESEWFNILSDYCKIKKNRDGLFFILNKSMEKHPIVTVSWDGSVAFANYLNKRKNLEPCYDVDNNRNCDISAKGFRLPTEAEWEYACRAGTRTPFNTGDNLTTEQANYYGNFPYKNYPEGKYVGTTTPVGAYPPNAWGLSDMHGNVWEWCMDWYSGTYYEECEKQGVVEDPQGPETGSSRVFRGGSWGSYAQYCRSAVRDDYHPGSSSFSVGFRLVFVP